MFFKPSFAPKAEFFAFIKLKETEVYLLSFQCKKIFQNLQMKEDLKFTLPVC